MTMGLFRSRPFRGVSVVLCASSLLGCGSKESAPPAASSAAAPASQAPSGEPAAAAPSAAAPDVEGRELLPFALDGLDGEFGKPASPPEKTETYQKVFRQLAAGKGGYCGAHTSGTVVCWGGTPAGGISGAYVQAAVADRFLCGLDNVGKVKCLPESASPSLAPPAPSAAAEPSAAPAADPSAAPSDSPAPAPAAPAEVKYKGIAAGPAHVCALDTAGHATCWGGEGACALPAPPDAAFRSLAVGSCHVCGRESTGAVRCWAPEGSAAAAPPDGLVAKELAAGDGFTCAVDGKGALVCWGTAPAAPADLPAEIESVGARGASVCVLAKGGALRCWGGMQVSKAGPYTGITVAASSVCAAVSKERLECFGADGSGQLAVPEDTSMRTVLDAGRTPEERAANKKRRADTFRELLGKLKEREAPAVFNRTTKIPVGRVVEPQYLPVLDLENFNQFFPRSHYHQGFALKTPGKKFHLLVMIDGAIPKLLSFDADGKRAGQLELVGYAMNTPDPILFDCGDVREEVVTESEIGADLKVTVKTTTLLESLGRVKNQAGKIQNYCKVRETTAVYAVSPLGTIDKMSSKTDVTHDKIADEACKGRWLVNPRNAEYTASPNLTKECACRQNKADCD